MTVTKDGTEVVITLNDTTVYIDGIENELDVPAQLSCGRTYVPLRFLAEVFGLDVDWDAENGVINIDDDTTGGESAE